MAAGFGQHGMPPPASNDRYSIGPRRLRLITWPCDLDFGGHGACGWCGSSSSIRIPSLKFVGLAVRKIWRMMCVGVNGPGNPDLWTLKLVCESHQRWGTFLPKLGTLGLWVLELFAIYATDGQKQRLPYSWGHNKPPNKCFQTFITVGKKARL